MSDTKVHIVVFDPSTNVETTMCVTLDEVERFVKESTDEQREGFLDDLSNENDKLYEPLLMIHNALAYGFEFDESAFQNTDDDAVLDVTALQWIGISVNSEEQAQTAIAIALYEQRKEESGL